MPVRARAGLFAHCLACLVWLAASLVPASALAWTDASVVSVGARVDASQPKSARVELQVGVQVVGGWLTQLEITGLPTDLALAQDAPAVFVSPDGSRYLPTVSALEPGVLVLTFADKKAAPRRGAHLLQVTYDTQTLHAAAEQAGSASRLRFSLPRWDVRLSDVRVVVLAPAGSSAASSGDPASVFDAVTTAQTADGRVEMSFARNALTRGQTFEVTFDLPAAVSGNARTGHAPAPWTKTAWLFSLAIAFLALLKHAVARRAAHAQHLTVVPLVPFSHEALRAGVVLAGCAAAAALEHMPLLGTALSIAAVLCALDVRMIRRALPASYTEREATYADLTPPARARARELAGLAAWFDATTPAGLCALMLVHAPGLWLAARGGESAPFLTSALLATPLFVTATRLSRPVRCEDVLHHLAAVRSDLGGLHARTKLVVLTTPEGVTLEARLRLVPARVPAGMGKLELAVTDDSVYGRPRWALSWVSQCRAGSVADGLLSQALPHAVREVGGDGCVRRRSVTLDVTADARSLLAWLDHDVLARAA